MKDKLIKVANDLADLAAAYEEKVTQKSWITPGWKEMLTNLYEYDPDELYFPEEMDPVELIHVLFMRLQEVEGRNKRTKKAVRQFDWPDEALRGILNPRVQIQDEPVAFARGDLEADIIRAQLAPNPFWRQPDEPNEEP